MNFVTTIQKLAGMLSVSVEVVSEPAPGKRGVLKASTEDGAKLFALALTKSGVAADSASYRSHHMVYVG